MDFSNQVVWITGASSGIGEALAQNFNNLGAKVILSARNAQKLHALADQMNAKSPCFALPLDLEQPETLAQKSQEALDKYGKVDVIVHCGGFSQRGRAEDTEMLVYRRLLEVHLLGPIAITKALIPQFKTRKTGNIVVISSLVGKIGSPMRTGYSSAKHAMHGFFDSLRMELHAFNVKVNIICPGYIRTNVSFNALNAAGETSNKMDKNQDQGLSPDACAKAIIKAIVTNKEEVYIGKKEVFAIYLKRIFPRLTDKIIRKKVESDKLV